MEIKNQDFLKKENLRLVLKMISDDGPISRAEIAKKMKMSPTSASRIVALLNRINLIEEVSINQRNVGRKANYFALNKNGIYFIGIELDGSYFRLGLMNFNEELIYKKTIDLQNSHPDIVVQKIKEEVGELKQKFHLTNNHILGLCVGMPGIIEPNQGIVNFSVQLQWKDYPLKDVLQEQLNIAIQVDNELKMKALSEYKFCGDSVNHLIILGFGSGVGSALISHGEISRGTSNFAGEIGHTIVDPNGTYCPCGNFGCLQTYIAEPFLLNEAAKIKKMDSMEELIREMENGAVWAKDLISRAIKYASIAINNTVCSFNPDMVILSGTLIENYPYIQEELLKEYSSTIWGPAKDSFEVKITETKDEGVILGAAIQMKRYFMENMEFLEGEKI
ncbi:ROK family transcriptional regulator [Oceanobacillus jeddahense]|uniref:ROK family transcriptional regulator n=1 Tax=Oceanobacillus jeddahense TaxID=1462527 RepID=A0ABY5JRI7_9BACI|nr:ROK family transcriptional regulator [Oceanobacillus jeddahense]UUI02938.1 ROK family transcriptional regulator [Oceanobacillus jeddahense]